MEQHLKALNGLLAKSDGRDKLLATLQYACMFISAGEAGDVKKVQVSVVKARKVFRVLKPLETLTPLILEPLPPGKRALYLEVITRIKSLCMAAYFLGDHVVWSSHAGLLTDKALVERAQKTSLWGWTLGSLCTIIEQVAELLLVAKIRRNGETEEEWVKRKEVALAVAQKRLLTLVHACVQATLAAGLLQLLPFKPRTVGALGIIASAMNCYMLLPPSQAALPAPEKAETKAKTT